MVPFGTPQVPDWLMRKFPEPFPSVMMPVKFAALAPSVNTLPVGGATVKRLLPLIVPPMVLLPELPMVLGARTLTGLFNAPLLAIVNVPPFNSKTPVPSEAPEFPSAILPADNETSPVIRLFVLFTVSVPEPALMSCTAPVMEPLPLKV